MFSWYRMSRLYRLSRASLLFAVVVVLSICVFAAQVGRAATVMVTNVNDSGAGSLRQAITDAVNGDIIVFDPSLQGQTLTLTSSELAINKRLTINGPGAGALTISGNNARRIFNVSAGGVVTITGLTIANGYINNASGGGIYNAGSLALVDSIVTQSRVDGSLIGVTSRGGGGIYNSGFLTVTRSIISNNADVYYSAGGGGIYNAGRLFLEESTVNGNQVHTTSTYGPYGGGGICNQQTAVITRSTILNNTATGYSYGGGGGIYNNGSLAIAYSTLTGNSANDTFGGGVLNMVSGTLTLDASTITGNQTTEDGGGIENVGVLTVTRSTINGNVAQGADYGGGGLDNTEGSVVIDNSTFSSNRAAANGGGIHNYDGAITLTLSTITSNTAQLGGGIYLTGTITDTLLDISNSIVGNSLSGTECFIYTGTVTVTTTLIEDYSCGALVGGDPQLGPLQDNGGDTFTHALQPGSPAIDQGGCNGATTDQRGYERPIDIPDITNAADGCDLGAFEVQYVDLLPAKTVNDDHPGPGQVITYTIVIQNVGFSTAREAVISDPLDGRLTAGLITLYPPGAGTIGTPPTLVSGAEIEAGQRITVTFPVTIAQAVPGGTVIVNTASATAEDVATSRSDSINITVKNVAPVPADDTVSTDEDTPIVIHSLANDTDLNGDLLSITRLGFPTYGRASINSGQQIVYTPTNRLADYADVFTYTVSDGSLIAIGSITVNVTADNDPLTVSDVISTTNEDTTIQGRLAANDPDTNDTLSYSLTAGPIYGTAAVNTTTGAWVYTPTNRLAAYTAIFTVAVVDTASHTSNATLTVNVTADNDAPTTNDATVGTNEDSTASGTIDATDPDADDVLGYSLTGLPAYGTASVNNVTGAWVYTPANRAANYTAVFTITATDTGANSDPARITVNVTADNDPLTASADVTTSTDEDTAATGTITATDPDTNDTIGFAVTNSPAYGSATVNASTGAWSYAPANRTANYTAVFTITATDTGSHSDPVRITVNVSADNDLVTADDSTVSISEDAIGSGTIAVGDPDTNDTFTYSITSDPAYGTATVNASTGAWTYTPINRMTNYTAIFTVTVTDSASHTDPARVTVNVAADNDAPTANDTTASTNEDTSTAGTLTASDPDTNDTLTYSLTSQPNYGAASVNAGTGAWVYTPTNRTVNYTAVFTITVADTASHTDPGRVTISVTADNDLPAANDATASTNEDTLATSTIAASDPDTNDTLTYSVTSGPNYGTASINTNTGAWEYMPANRTVNYTAVFTITVTDSANHADPARVTVNVNADNDPVTANDSTVSTNEDTLATGTVNASDPDTNDTLTYSVTSNPTYGAASVNANTGAWTYTPINRTANYAAVFTITVTDSGGHAAPARITVNVTADNDAPAANDATASTTEDTPTSGTLVATDPDTNDTLNYTITTNPNYGTASINATTGAWTYTPINRTANYTAIFTVTAADLGGRSDLARVTVSVTADNDAPTANDAAASTNEDTVANGTIAGTDPDTNDTLSYAITTSPNYGSASINAATGGWTYTPINRTVNYTAIFTVSVSDLGGRSDPARITVNVTADNDAPTANDVTVSTNEDTPSSGTLAASDPDTNDTLSYAITTNPVYGTASINATTGAWTYTPINRMANYTAVFTVTATDLGGRSDPARVTVNVTADNDAPTANDVTVSTNEDTPSSGTLAASDPDSNDTLSYAITTNPVYGTASINATTGAWTYTPINRMANYTAVFTVTATDLGGRSDPARVTVNVSADNDPASTSDATVSTNEDTTATGTLVAIDPDTNDTLTYSVTANPGYGAASVNSSTGAWVYTPANRMASYTAVFTVTVADTGGHTAPARITINVTANNDAPVANNATVSTSEDTAANSTLVATDPDTNDTLSYAITTNPIYGNASINSATGAWTYMPINRTANYTAIFTVTVTDTGSHAVPARITVNVTADNDTPTANDTTASATEDTSINGLLVATDPDTNDTLSYVITTNPNYGTATITSITGAWVYTPTNRTSNYTAIFTVTVTDLGGRSDPARVTVNVTADNDAPTASDATTSANEDTSINGTVVVSDPDTNDTLSYGITSNPIDGSAAINSTTGAWTYTPINRMANYTAVFTVTVTDLGGRSDPARITINVTADNDAPTANNATASTNEDTSATSMLVASDPDTNDTLTYSIMNNPNYGTASVNATTGAWIYTPINRMANYTAIFTVTVADTGSHAVPARITVNVTANNDAPTANHATASTNEDTSANGTIVAADPDTNDTLSYAITTNPVYGTATINASSGAWMYAPTNRTASYAAVFTITVADTGGHTTPARVTVNVTADNDPIAASDSVTSTTEDSPITGTISISDPDTNDIATFALTGEPAYGAASVNAITGRWAYTPTNQMINYTAIFTITVADTGGHADNAQVTIGVTAHNEPPTAEDAIVATNEDTPLTGTLSATDPDTFDALSYHVANAPEYGTARINPTTGTWIYTPTNRTANYTTVFTLAATDTANHTALGAITVNVTADNDSLSASAALTTTSESASIAGTIVAADPDTNDVLIYTLTNAPEYGSVAVNAATGTWVYTPTNRTASYTSVFTVTVADTAAHTAAAPITINVLADNDTPTAHNATISTNEDTPITGTLVANDPDTNDTLSYALTTYPGFGWASVNSVSGAWIYTPTNRTADYTAIFTVTVTDTGGHAVLARVTVEVSANNDAPATSNVTLATDEDTPVVGYLAASDPDTNDTLTYSISGDPNYGSASVHPALGTWTYTPANRTGNYTAVFTITVTDSDHNPAAARLTLHVNADNDLPEFTTQPITTTISGRFYGYTLLTLDPDTDDTLTITAVTKPDWLTLIDHGDGTAELSGTPANADAGSHMVELNVIDSGGLVTAQRFTVAVTARVYLPLARR